MDSFINNLEPLKKVDMHNYTGKHIGLDIFGCNYKQLEDQAYLIRVLEEFSGIKVSSYTVIEVVF